MKLYEVNQAIEGIFELLVDPETGELLPDENLLEQLDALQLERSRILEYLAKLVLNTRSQMTALKEEEKRLKERRASLERKDERLMAILDRECAGQKTDCGVATICINYYDLGYDTGMMACDILTGKADIAQLPIAYSPTFTRVVNAEMCDILGIAIPEGYQPVGK